MQTWRIIATALLAMGGAVLVLVAMAKARDRRRSSGGQVAVTGAIASVVLLLACVFTLTVLPQVLVWSLVVIVAVVVSVLVLVS